MLQGRSCSPSALVLIKIRSTRGFPSDIHQSIEGTHGGFGSVHLRLDRASLLVWSGVCVKEMGGRWRGHG